VLTALEAVVAPEAVLLAVVALALALVPVVGVAVAVHALPRLLTPMPTSVAALDPEQAPVVALSAGVVGAARTLRLKAPAPPQR
jgi:hypothetical protein